MDQTGPSKGQRSIDAAAAPSPTALPTSPAADAPIAPFNGFSSGRRRPWRRPLAWLLYLFGAVVILFVGLVLVAAASDFGGWAGNNTIENRAVRVGLVLLIALLFPLFHLVKKLTALTAEEVLVKDPRPLVLLLRSFKIDSDQILRQWGVRLASALFGGVRETNSPEQAFVAELQNIGPVVAIGKPGEQLPKLGAARMYVAHDQWQAKVRELSSRAALTVLGIGETEGLFWEVERVAREADPTRVLLYEPPVLKERDRIYQRFQERANKVLPKPLPEELGLARYIGFHADWTPVPLVDLAPLYHRFGIAAEPRRGCLKSIARGAFWFFLIVVGLVAVLGIIGAIFGGDPNPPSKVLFSRKVTAPDAMPYAWFGTSVAVSDGRLLVGAPGYSRPVGSAGAAFAFDRDGVRLQHVLQPPSLNEGAMMGGVVAAGGGKAVIATLRSIGHRTAYLAHLDGAVSFTELSNPLRSSADDGYGESVAIREPYLALSAPRAGDRGTAHLFHLSDGKAIVSVGPRSLAPDAQIASSVALGERILFIAGNQPAGEPRGVVYAIELGKDGKRFQLRPDVEDEMGFGNVMACAGGTLVVGTLPMMGNGRVYVFDARSGERRARFELQGNSLDAGYATSVATNGYLVAVGAPRFEVSGRAVGAVFIYEIKTQREIARLQPLEDKPETSFGSSIAIDRQGIVVGAPDEDAGGKRAGAVYVYRFE